MVILVSTNNPYENRDIIYMDEAKKGKVPVRQLNILSNVFACKADVFTSGKDDSHK